MSDILTKIVTKKRAEIEAAKAARPLDFLQERLQKAPAPLNFVEAFGRQSTIALIAEVKKASPSAGLIRANFNPAEIATEYEQYGASCISCLTDQEFFQGHLDDLQAVRDAVSIPVLRKDFILDRYQIFEARAAGADCVLLIAECLDDSSLTELYEQSNELGMQSLIEIYEAANLDRVLKLNPPMIGINNRNLRTFETTIDHSIALSRNVPSDCLLVSESGIHNRADVLQLQENGIGAILVGETLMRSESIAAKVRELLGTT